MGDRLRVAAATALLGWLLGGILNAVLVWIFATFNAGFQRATGAYTRTVGHLLRVSAWS